MLSGLGIIVPVKYQVREIDAQLRAAAELYWKEWDVKQPKFKAENVVFGHDSEWRNRFFSITCVRDGNRWFWRATKVFVGVTSGGIF